MISRREFFFRTGAAAVAFTLLPATRGLARAKAAKLEQSFTKIEKDVVGRLGVAIHDTGSLLKAARRGDERFPMCSTFKLLAVAAVLKRVDDGSETLSREVPIPKAAILEYAPVTKDHAGGSMTLSDLCAAAMVRSDNTAANLILESLAQNGKSGPEAATAFVRSLGDGVTQMDRMEPELNEYAPDDPRDTTTPNAMLSDLNALIIGDALSPVSRDRLTEWFVACATGKDRLRAGLPDTWRIGDKTGTGPKGTSNDVAVAWPGGGEPILITAYLTGSKADAKARDAALAEVGSTVAAAIG